MRHLSDIYPTKTLFVRSIVGLICITFVLIFYTCDPVRSNRTSQLEITDCEAKWRYAQSKWIHWIIKEAECKNKVDSLQCVIDSLEKDEDFIILESYGNWTHPVYRFQIIGDSIVELPPLKAPKYRIKIPRKDW